MRNHYAGIGICVLLIVGLAGPVFALPEYMPAPPFAPQHKSDRLTLQCGIPAIFDPLVSGAERHEAFAVPLAESQPPPGLAISDEPQVVPAAIPEPGSLVLLGLGVAVIGIIRRAARRRL